MNKIVFVFDPNDSHIQMVKFSDLVSDKMKQKTKLLIPEISLIRLRKNKFTSEIAKVNLDWIRHNSINIEFLPRSGRTGALYFSNCLEQIGRDCDVFLFTSTTPVQTILKRKIPLQGSRLISLSLIKPTTNYEKFYSKDGIVLYRVTMEPQIINTTTFRTKYRSSGEPYVYPIQSRVLLNEEPRGWVKF